MTTAKTLDALSQLFPPARLLTHPAELIPYESDALTAYRARPLAVVLPETQAEVVAAVRLCHELGVPFVARGSGTSLSGGSLPIAEGIVIGLNRLNRIVRLDPRQRIVVVEPGVINLEVTKAAAPHGLYFAPDPSSQPVCTIGGNIAFNSGGAHCLKYGMTSNHVLGLRAVLADGAVVTLGGDSLEGAGPDLPGLFVGCEGLFGVALEATLRLLPKVERYRTVLAAFRSLQAAGDAVGMVVAAGLLPGAIEIMDNLAIQAAEASVHAGYPRDAAGLLIVELEGEAVQVEAEFAQLLQVIERSGPYEVRVAQDDAQRMKIWKGRKGAFSAVGRLSPDYIVQDGVVPRGQLGLALAEIERLSQKYNLRCANVFHAGDGNLHPLILYNGREPGAYARAEEMAGEILHLCVRLNGSITGEHGVGVEKRAYLPVMFNAVDIESMQRIRRAMDPKEIANRGKMLPVNSAAPGSLLDPAVVATVEALRIPKLLRPATVAEVQEAVRTCQRILPQGGGTKPGLSTPHEDNVTVLSLSQLAGVLEYVPEEYTFTALAGTPVAEVEALLAQHGQYLPCDPPLSQAGATLGGSVAAGLSGPGRYRYGGVRDFILDVRFVDGLGQVVHSGGKVVKNAAGFDLPKLMVGSAGRLGVLLELTFKVFPRPRVFATLRRDYADLSSALEAMIRLSVAPLDIEALDLEPRQRGSTLWVRIGGWAEPLAGRLGRLRALLGGGDTLTGDDEDAYWQTARQLSWAPADWSLVKIPITPLRIPALEEHAASADSRQRYSAGGNVAWLALPGRLAGLDNTLIELQLGGVVLRGPANLPHLGIRQGLPFAQRVKQALDPMERFLEV
jgi:glycolate oxidase